MSGTMTPDVQRLIDDAVSEWANSADTLESLGGLIRKRLTAAGLAVVSLEPNQGVLSAEACRAYRVLIRAANLLAERG